MNKLIFREIAIISPSSKTAKLQDFSDGINVVTSPKDKKGNWVGKSSLLKSLYHCLGADSCFDDSWSSEGEYIYVLDFQFKEKTYYIFRYGKLFKLYDSNKKLLFKVANREELSKKLSLIFDISIRLRDQSKEKKYADALPVYWYLLNFTDQTDLKPCEFDSFKNLGASSYYYSDLIYSHLGLRNDQLNQINSEIDQLNCQKKDCEEEIRLYDKVYATLKENSAPIVDEKAITESLNKYKEEYEMVLSELNKSHNKLEEAYTHKAELESLLNDLDKYIEEQNDDIKEFEIKQQCPHCGTILEGNKIYYFKRIKDIDGFGLQKLEVEKQLALCERSITVELNKYNLLRQKINSIQEELNNDKTVNKNDIRNLGLSNTINDVIKRQKELSDFLANIEENIKSKSKFAKELEKERFSINEYYCIQLSDVSAKYSIPGFSVATIKTPIDKFNVGGTVNNVAKMIWLSSLLRTRYAKNTSYPLFPLVIDTPNNADFDDENNKKIFEIIFDMQEFDGQIITSLIGFNKDNYTKYKNINVICLNNEQRHLLNEYDYIELQTKYDFLELFE